MFGLEAAVVLVRFREKITFAELGLVFQFGFAMFLCGILFLNVSGGVYKNSCKLASVLQTEKVLRMGTEFGIVRSQIVEKFTRKVVKSLRPFGVSCGPTRAFTYNSMLEFFVLVASGVTSLLVNLRERET